MSLNEREAIRDLRLLVKCGAVLVLVFAGFIAIPPSTSSRPSLR